MITLKDRLVLIQRSNLRHCVCATRRNFRTCFILKIKRSTPKFWKNNNNKDNNDNDNDNNNDNLYSAIFRDIYDQMRFSKKFALGLGLGLGLGLWLGLGFV